MSDLVEFLRDRVDEDEAAARTAQPGPWETWPAGMPGEHVVGRVSPAGRRDPHLVCTTHGLRCAEGDAEHIARHDPARVLAEVAAKRAILDEIDVAEENLPAHGDASDQPVVIYVAKLRAAQHLVKVYADHPDFDPAWRLA